MRNIYFFSWTHLWSMRSGAGAPSYHHTIMYYINSPDWNVHLFTADATNLELDIANEGKVHLFQASDFVERGLLHSKVNQVYKRIKNREFVRWAEKEAEKVIDTDGENYVYAYEIWGVEAAKKIARKYQFPLITRFQGTVLCSEKDTLKNRIRRYPHYEALKTPADLIVMTDDGTFGDEVLHRLGNNSKCLFIRNGLDLYSCYRKIRETTNTEDVRQHLSVDGKEKILLMASRLTSWKRVDRGITALKEVLKVRRDIRLLIAGDGDSKKSLEKYAAEIGVIDHVTFLGSVLQKELYKYMLASDIFMSLYDIGNLGNPTFEAMLMGRPIIALNNGATYTVLQDGVNSRLLNVGDIDQLPGLILHLFSHPEECEFIAKGALQYAEENFYTWDGRMRCEENAVLATKNSRKDKGGSQNARFFVL